MRSTRRIANILCLIAVLLCGAWLWTTRAMGRTYARPVWNLAAANPDVPQLETAGQLASEGAYTATRDATTPPLILFGILIPLLLWNALAPADRGKAGAA